MWTLLWYKYIHCWTLLADQTSLKKSLKGFKIAPLVEETHSCTIVIVTQWSFCLQ